MKQGVKLKAFSDLESYNPNSTEDYAEKNFSVWHQQLVIRASDAGLSYHARRFVLMSKVRGEKQYEDCQFGARPTPRSRPGAELAVLP